MNAKAEGPRLRERRTFSWVASILVAALVAACSAPPPETGGYAGEIARARASKDQQFRESADSPIPPARRDALLPLPYFPIDEDARVPAAFTPTSDGQVVEMPTSTGKRREMRQVGVLHFTYKEQALTLGAFTEAGAPVDRLFVPFTDLTTGAETYAAGRYLDLDPTRTGIYNIDFNRAYHPFCYYDARFDCPYPPSQNRLKVPIRAGERLPM